MSKPRMTGEFEIVNPLGLHASAANRFASLANRYEADVWIAKDGTEVNAKSVLGVLMLACPQGSVIGLRCEGVDAEKAYQALGKLINSGFGEL